MRKPLRSAIVHDFFIQDGGAERCALEFARLLPDADVYTTFFATSTFADRIDPQRVRRWPLERLVQPGAGFRRLLPLYPIHFSRLDLTDYDLVVSSSVAFSKAVRTSGGARHVTYVYTPMRYAWGLDEYLQGGSFSVGAKFAARTLRPLLQKWDRYTARRPDVIVAISETVRARIRRFWLREADTVIYPPVDVEQIPLSRLDDGYFLVAARMLRYRRLDLVVDACTRSGRPLIVVGDGPERRSLERRAGPTVRFLGHVTREALVGLFRRCHAYVVPGVEDFGIAPVEAMAAGKPVIAFGRGGVAETVVHGETGILFDDQTVESLETAMALCDATSFSPEATRARALLFDREVFVRRWTELLEQLEAGISRRAA